MNIKRTNDNYGMCYVKAINVNTTKSMKPISKKKYEYWKQPQGIGTKYFLKKYLFWFVVSMSRKTLDALIFRSIDEIYFAYEKNFLLGTLYVEPNLPLFPTIFSK